MESDGDDAGDIFEEHENQENDGANAENTTESAAGVRVQPPKRIVKNPRLKFNPERLCGERGIPVLLDHFKNVKFKGKGHEKDDLDKLMGSLEHWTHRLFPSMKFEDCLNQIEKLGKKRPVQTCLAKIRMDMPILNSDFVGDDEEDNVLRNDDPDPEPVVEDPFDRLIAESQDVSNIPYQDTIEANLISSTPDDMRGQVLGSTFSSSLTEEQKERMRHNRMLAADRRKVKLASLQLNTSDTESANHNSASSQDLSSAFDSMFKSSAAANVDSISDITTINVEKDIGNGNMNNCFSIPNNQNSENLGLEDLMDLVDEDESVPDKHDTVKLPEQIDHNENEDSAPDNHNSENIKIDDMHLVGKNKSISGKNAAVKFTDESSAVCQSLNEENGNKMELSLEETIPFNALTKCLDMDSTLKVVYNEQAESNKVSENAKADDSLVETVPISVSQTNINLVSTFETVNETTKTKEESRVAKDELLGLESMMDLVDEEE